MNVRTAGTSRCTTRVSSGGPLSLDSLRARPYFAAGSYYIIAEVNSSYPSYEANIAVDINLTPPPPPTITHYQTINVGGIRVARTLDLTETGDTIVKVFRYRQASTDGAERSSGTLFFQPEYAYMRPCGELVVSEQNIGKLNWLDAGFHVGYSRVEVESGGRKAGTTVYHYNNSRSFGPSCRDVVTKVEDFSQAGELVKQTINNYSFEPIASSPGFRLSKEYNVQRYGADPLGAPMLGAGVDVSASYWFATRSYRSYWPKLNSTTEQVFGSGGTVSSRQDTTAYSYLPYGAGQTTQPVRVVKYLDRRRQLITRTQYCGQYALGSVTNSSSPAVGLVGLAQRNMVSVPIEHQTWLRTGADSAVVGGDLTHFADRRPARIFALTPAAPIPAATFVPSAVRGGVFQQDARYLERVAFPRYSALGSLLQQQVAQAPPSSYLWGHAESKLIAEAQNAAYSQIAFTSFEPDASGSWEYDESRVVTTAFTGTRAFALDNGAGTLRRPGLPAGEYELLLWAHGPNVPQLSGATSPAPELLATAGAWRQYRYRPRTSATTTLQLQTGQNYGIWIDEVRLHPVEAQMTSYTYDPLVGLTSQTDPGGRTLTYEYDAVGRLVRVRDEQGRLLSQQDYHYARPQ